MPDFETHRGGDGLTGRGSDAHPASGHRVRGDRVEEHRVKEHRVEEHRVEEDTVRVLVADDETFVRNAFQLYLETYGYLCSAAENGPRALQILKQSPNLFDVLLLDLVMPGMCGIDVLREAKRIDSDLEIIIATGCGTVQSAVEAIRFGAFDYITKPIVNFEEDLLSVIQSAVAKRRTRIADQRVLEERSGVTFQDLEAVAATMLRQQSEDFHRQFANILTRHYQADAAVLARENHEGALEICHHWGELNPPPPGSAARPTLDLVGTTLWRDLLEGEGRWWSACFPLDLLPQAELDGYAVERPLQILRASIPLSYAAVHLLLLRRGDPLTPPPMALLRVLTLNAIQQFEWISESHAERCAR